MNSRRYDLNLLPVLNAILSELNVSRAAAALAMSQPAVSSALNRARAVFDDRLFVKVPGGVAPTPRMAALGADIRRIIDRSHDLAAPHDFDPAGLRTTFHLSITDSLGRRVVSPLVGALSARAPGARLHVLPHSNAGSAGALVRGTLDCAVGMFPDVPEGLRTEIVRTDQMVCIMRKGHPLAKRLNREEFLGADHIWITPSGKKQGFVDAWLSDHGLRRNIAVIVGNYSDAMEIVASTDFIACVPEGFARDAPGGGVIAKPVPFRLQPISYKLLWHDRLSADPAHRWFRALLSSLIAPTELEAPKGAVPTARVSAIRP